MIFHTFASHERTQTALKEERDKLLAEKASWVNKAALEGVTVTEDTTRNWEVEKGELVKARDSALAEAKVRDCC